MKLSNLYNQILIESLINENRGYKDVDIKK